MHRLNPHLTAPATSQYSSSNSRSRNSSPVEYSNFCVKRGQSDTNLSMQSSGNSKPASRIDILKYSLHHLNLHRSSGQAETATAADSTDNSPSKREHVKKKWKNFKRSVRRQSHRRFHRKSGDSKNSDSEHSNNEEGQNQYDKDDDEDDDYHKNYNESDQETNEDDEKPELPVISNEAGYYWIGKDYYNTYKSGAKNTADFSRDQFDRTEVPRMPWRDQGLAFIGESARDLARHFIQRWNQCKREKTRHNEAYPFLLPKSYSELFEPDYQSWFKDQLFTCEVQVCKLEVFIFVRLSNIFVKSKKKFDRTFFSHYQF